MFESKSHPEYDVLTTRPGHPNIQEVQSLLTLPLAHFQNHRMAEFFSPQCATVECVITAGMALSVAQIVADDMTATKVKPFDLPEKFFSQCLLEVSSALAFLERRDIYHEKLSFKDMFIRSDSTIYVGNLGFAHRYQSATRDRLIVSLHCYN